MLDTNPTSPVNVYESWALSHGLILGLNADPLDDPDNDGCPNYKEFAFDGDPLSGADDGKVRAAIIDDGGSDYLSITLPVRSGTVFSGSPVLTASLDGLTYLIEGSTNLETWIVPVTEISPALDAGLPPLSPGWEYHSFRLDTPVPLAPRGFLRAGVGLGSF